VGAGGGETVRVEPDQDFDRTERSLAALDEADRRLEERSREREGQRERLRRRAARRDKLRLPVAVLGLGVLGAVVFVATIEGVGGDFRNAPVGMAAAIVAVELLLPALVAAVVVRREGRAIAVAAALIVVSIELALSFGVAFAVLRLGPV
jgi:drug/metabolite transporter (DMT)-like permease